MNFTKLFLSLSVLFFLLLPVFSFPMVSAAGSLLDKQVGIDDGTLGKAFDQSGDPTDPRAIVVNILKVFLTFLGIISVALVMWGGFTWMTAGGSEDKVGTAKKIITQAIIGLIIILCSYAITSYISTCVLDVVSGQSTMWMCND